MDLASVTKKIRGSNRRSSDHFNGIGQLAVARLVPIPDLLKPCGFRVKITVLSLHVVGPIGCHTRSTHYTRASLVIKINQRLGSRILYI